MNNATGSVMGAQLFTQVVQVTQGVVLVITNLLLITTILYHQSLRDKKEYIFILGVALTDFIFSFALFRGITNIYNMLHGLSPPYTRHKCLLQFNVLVLTFSMPAQGLMLLFQTIDRLLAVTMPLDYFGFQVSYAWKMVSVPFVYSAAQSFLLYFVTWGDKKFVGRGICAPKRGLNPLGFVWWHNTHTAYGFAAVGLYGVVAMLYWKHVKKVMPEGNSAANAEKKKSMSAQAKMVISIGISALFTLVLFVLPRMCNILLLTVTSPKRGLLITLHMFAAVCYNLNPILNLFIYMKRHKEVRMGVVKMFKREELPEDLEQLALAGNKETKSKGKQSRKTTKV